MQIITLHSSSLFCMQTTFRRNVCLSTFFLTFVVQISSVYSGRVTDRVNTGGRPTGQLLAQSLGLD